MSKTEVNPGDLLMGKYRVVRKIGAGAMGVVYAAVHDTLEQRVAIKVLPGAAEGEPRTRFLREARATSRLKTQHVAKVVDVGTMDDGAPYMIMEYLDGRDLAAEVAARGPLPIEEAVGLVLQACEALAEAHAAGIVHRDVKPANLFLTTGPGGSPCVKVLDFGISRVVGEVGVTGDLAALGSPLYMSPEQMRASKDADARSDVWSLAVSLYELVAGKTPFHGATIDAVCTKVVADPPEPLATYRSDAPAGFEAVLGQALQKDRARRFPSVAAFAAALAPYGPEGSAAQAAQVAKVLGEEVATSRRTDVLPPEPAAETTAPPATGTTAPGAATRTAVARSSPEPTPAAKPRLWMIAAALAATITGGAGSLGIAVWLRSGAAPPSTGPVTVAPAAAEPDAEVPAPADAAADASAAPVDAGPAPAVTSRAIAPAARPVDTRLTPAKPAKPVEPAATATAKTKPRTSVDDE